MLTTKSPPRSPLDQDTLAALETADKRLYVLIHQAVKYRSLIRMTLRHLRQGADPGQARAELERWRGIIRDVKRLSREL